MSCFDDGNCNAVQIEYDGNGTLTQYTFPFSYEDELEVHVEQWDAVNFRYNRIDRDQWSFDNLTTIKFEDAPDYTFRIMRETDLEEMEVTFYPGSSIRAQDLNANFEQLQHAIQEGWCRVSDEFYCYLDEFIFDKRDAWTKEEQQSGQVVPEGDKIFLDDAITARTDTYLQDNKPAEPTYEQGGKRWYDTNEVLNYIWNDQINAWIDYSRMGPQGPKGEDGSYRIITALKQPERRPSGDGLCNGDIWLNTCNFDIFIYWEGQWIAFGNSGPRGEQGKTGATSTIIGLMPPKERPNGDPLEPGDMWFNTCQGEAFWYYNDQWVSFGTIGPQGPKGDTGNYQVICSVRQPATRSSGGPLQCGDIWFNTCIGEIFIWYEGVWLNGGSQGGRGEDGKDGATIWLGDFPPIDKEKYPLWYNTNCATKEGLYIWFEDESVWVNTNTPGPKGDKGDAGDGSGGVDDLTFVAPIQRIDDDVVFSWNSINELPD